MKFIKGFNMELREELSWRISFNYAYVKLWMKGWSTNEMELRQKVC
jgi:hypothetical protein